ncbi:hypothetical protein [Phormidium sp. CCY1219]|uniref:hypothetical protein n=1 Tax=Phormidium sp. CCY1219 TaxID=2886104 RepID=UPI002D1F71E9|nr:hypothetical protein [Phormidium sp. CCY1219]MEB3828947.1 hypothetical protein [Phormidium sp. CCY1219]
MVKEKGYERSRNLMLHVRQTEGENAVFIRGWAGFWLIPCHPMEMRSQNWCRSDRHRFRGGVGVWVARLRNEPAKTRGGDRAIIGQSAFVPKLKQVEKSSERPKRPG